MVVQREGSEKGRGRKERDAHTCFEFLFWLRRCSCDGSSRRALYLRTLRTRLAKLTIEPAFRSLPWTYMQTYIRWRAHRLPEVLQNPASCTSVLRRALIISKAATGTLWQDRQALPNTAQHPEKLGLQPFIDEVEDVERYLPGGYHPSK